LDAVGKKRVTAGYLITAFKYESSTFTSSTPNGEAALHSKQNTHTHSMMNL